MPQKPRIFWNKFPQTQNENASNKRVQAIGAKPRLSLVRDVQSSLIMSSKALLPLMVYALAGAGLAPLAHAADAFPYDLSAPDATLELPNALREVSGIVVLTDDLLACIEDEHGVVYGVDAADGGILTQTTFAARGDYEGLARTDRSLYALRSDGDLFEVSDVPHANPRITRHETQIPAKDNEGLCYDAANNRLLIAAKSKSGKGSEWKNKRIVYAFDLETKTHAEQPAFTFELKSIDDFALTQGITRTKKIKFRPSAIGIHPKNGHLYLISAADHLLFVFTAEGMAKHIEPLDPELFPKAEGLAFTPAGDLYISNEGIKTPATILKFNPWTAK
jgi:SdiA-regulated